MLSSDVMLGYDFEDDYDDSYSGDWPSFEEWLIDEFDEDAETAYWDLDQSEHRVRSMGCTFALGYTKQYAENYQTN